MSENSNIEWTDHTFNPWIGCTKVSPGCLHCYAETLMDTRYKRVKWGAGNPRSRTSAANWSKPLHWNREAGRGEFGQCWACGRRGVSPPVGTACPACNAVNTHHYSERATGASIRPRVFCASLADWLDDEAPIEWLADLLKLIHATPNLDWLLLTKRPENWSLRLQAAFSHVTGADARGWLESWLAADVTGPLAGVPPENVWIGTTVEDQTRADERIPALLKIPAKVRFLSCEPLLSEVDLHFTYSEDSEAFPFPWWPDRMTEPTERLHWVICGGESGAGKRPMNLEWAHNLYEQCAEAGVPFFMKQIDKVQPIPAALMIRQFPLCANTPWPEETAQTLAGQPTAGSNPGSSHDREDATTLTKSES